MWHCAQFPLLNHLENMQKLRSIHLYLGCIFAPMLLFFAISGIWQIFGFQNSGFLQLLSTIHTSHRLKSGAHLGNPVLVGFILLMAVSFIITTLLGVVMALNFGRNRKTAFACLAAGVLCPLIFVLL